MTSGLVILDVRGRGLSGIGVMVDDFEGSHGDVRFVARTVEDVTETAGKPAVAADAACARSLNDKS